MSLTIHHLHRSQSERIVWLCEELSALDPSFQYQLVQHDRDPITALAPTSLKDISSARTAPVMIDTTVTPRVVLAESQAIVEYVVQTHGSKNLSVSPGSENYAHYVSWLNFANGSLQPGLTRLGTVDLVLKAMARMRSKETQQATKTEDEARQDGANMASVVDPLTAMIKARLYNHLDMIDTRLGESRYLAGSTLTAADIMTVFSLTTMRGFYPYSLGKYANILRYLSDIAQRPAYVKAFQRAEPGMKPLIAAEVEAFDFRAFK